MKLNKQTYKSGLDCFRKGYFEKTKENKTNPQETYMVFYNYQKLKDLAVLYMKDKYRAKCIDVEKFKDVKYFNDKIRVTKQLIQSGRYQCIINACLDNGPIQGRIDFLVKAPDGLRYSPVLVKSSEDVKEGIAVDAAYACALLKDQVEVDKVHYIATNKLKTKSGKFNIYDLLYMSSRYEGKELMSLAEENAVDFVFCEDLLRQNNIPTNPSSFISKNCKYCEWRDKCVKRGDLPEYGTLDLIYGKETAVEHFKNGEKLLKDVSYDDRFDLRQNIQIYCEKHPDTFILEPKKIEKFLKQMKTPYHFMDFEAINTMVPRVEGTRPFEFVPFQYSLHQTMDDLKIYNHDEYLSFDMDCRKEFLDRLLDSLGDEGSIIVWNQEFEESRMEELADQFPEYRSRIEALKPRYFDLMVIFEKLWFYKKEMYGKYSLKYVFPALTDVKSYHDLNVRNGLQTMILYFKILKGEEKVEDHEKDMLAYCGLDTESMIYILDEVRKTIKNTGADKFTSIKVAKQEIEAAQVEERYKRTFIPNVTLSVIQGILQDVDTQDIDIQGYKRVSDWMKDNKDKEITLQNGNIVKTNDIINYWNSLPLSTTTDAMSKGKIFDFIKESRIIINFTNTPKHQKNAVTEAKAKTVKTDKVSEKEAEIKENEVSEENKEVIEEKIVEKPKKRGRPRKSKTEEPKVEKVEEPIKEEIDANKTNLDTTDIQNLIDDIETQFENDYGSFSDVLSQFEKPSDKDKT